MTKLIKCVLTNTTMWYIVISESAFLDPSTLHSLTILKEGIKGKTITKKVNQRDRKEVLKMAKLDPIVEFREEWPSGEHC